MDIPDEATGQPASAAKQPSARRRSAAANGKSRKPASLACLNCRPRKIKCQRIDGSCERCRALNLPCKVPDRDERKLRYSKEYIESLENEIVELKRELAQARGLEPVTAPSKQTDTRYTANRVSEAPTNNVREKEESPTDSLIERLCGMRRRVNNNSDGQNRFFGPTSSLHLTENPCSISNYTNGSSYNDLDFDNGIPEALQYKLLDLYWTYQHSILPVIHKEAFIIGLQTGRGPYYSRALLLCLLASGARISQHPQIRALSIPIEDDLDKSIRKPLMKMAEEALEKETANPSITTIQSLLLLSVMYCIQSNDSKGWMLSGSACRLVFDLGLHQDWAYLPATNLTQLDIEVRQVAFWGCFSLDRLWALYLGRPAYIKLSDVSTRQPDSDAHTWDLRIFAAWVKLIDIAGQIGDKLNTNSCSQSQIDHYAEALQKWYSTLHPNLTIHTQAHPAVYHLHFQYSGMTILLNRHNAGFGNPVKGKTAEASTSRQECVSHAFRIAHLLEDYTKQHGGAGTMVGSALYNITMAAITFVAELSETRKEGSSDELSALTTCLRAMKEMEHVEIVARNVYNIVRTIMRNCNVRPENLELGPLSVSDTSSVTQRSPPPISYDHSAIGLNQTTLAMWPAFDFEGVELDLDDEFPFAFEQPTLQGSQPDVMPIAQYL